MQPVIIKPKADKFRSKGLAQKELEGFADTILSASQRCSYAIYDTNKQNPVNIDLLRLEIKTDRQEFLDELLPFYDLKIKR